MSEPRDAVRLDDLLRETVAALRDAGIDGATREARVMVAHFAGVSATELIAGTGQPVGAEAQAGLKDALWRRARGEPLYRILGRRGFYGIELALSPETLEPRPDTEILVDRIIPHARRIIADAGTCRLLDLGTGTGAIALAMLKEVEGATALGVDIAEGAVRTALANARANGLDGRFEARRSDWFSAIDGKFHIIVSNPPYIGEDEYQRLDAEVREFDPKIALLGGSDGLEAYRAIAVSAADYLSPGGVVAVEIGYTQREAVAAIFKENGYRLLESARDLAGNDRALIFDSQR